MLHLKGIKKIMKITVAIDSFKGSLSTLEAGEAAKNGITRVFPDAKVSVCPLADGGEGTVDALTLGRAENLRAVTVSDPLGRPTVARYGMINGGKTAIIEIAAAAGITLISREERDPLRTTTYGAGELIRDAIGRGCRDFIVGIGGSATNDCGLGMLSALGFEFSDADGNPIPMGAEGVGQCRRISREHAAAELRECTFHIACDVTNPLYGERGCSAVYGPQKGATAETVPLMDGWLRDFSRLAAETLGVDNAELPGAGAAGGLGYAFVSFLGGRLESGIDLVIRETRLEDEIKDSDLVITGEGRLDEQSVMGKAPIGVASIAKKYGVPVIAVSGCVTDGARLCNDSGIDAFFPIVRRPCTLAEAMERKTAQANLADTVEQAIRLMSAVGFGGH